MICLGCGDVDGHHSENCWAAQEAKEHKAYLHLFRMVVSASAGVQGIARCGVEHGDTRLHGSAMDVPSATETEIRRQSMGKIHGVHDSYCSLMCPSDGGPGAAKVCTCESGRAYNRLLVDAGWEVRAKAYADDFLERMSKWSESEAIAQPARDYLKFLHERLVQMWKEANPRPSTGVPDPAPVAPPAAPVVSEPPTPDGGSEDGPGEEDGPWAEGWGERAGEPLHAAWYDLHRKEIQMTHPKRVWDMWHEFKGDEDVVVLYGFAPLPPKADHGKPKIHQFFMQQFPLSIQQVAFHMEGGCRDPGHVFLGWQEVENGYERYSDAMLRHHLEEIVATVTDMDREEGVDHAEVEERQAIAVAANALIRLELLLRKRRNLNLDARSRA